MAEPLKNGYDRAYLERLAETLDACAPAGIDRHAFLDAAFAEGWEELELKGRMRRITEATRAVLPTDYLDALPIVRGAAASFGGYLSMHFPDFVEQYGLDDWDPSVDALRWLTRFGSSEFAVRPFLAKDPARMVATMREWADNRNEHVRRLASEGCRPRLPWAMNLPVFQDDPAPLLPILEALHDDDSDYVRRSVANNLNDIAKDHPEVTLTTTERWQGKSEQIDRVVKHACRTLLREGHPRAMRMFGFRDPADITLTDLRLDQETVPLGGDLHFHFQLDAPDSLGRIRLEYRIDFARPHGRGARKVFQIGESDCSDSCRAVSRRHSFVDRSTRKHYPGDHRLTVIVNGVAKAETHFALAD